MSLFSEILNELRRECEIIGVPSELLLTYAWQLLQAATKKTKTQLIAEKSLTLTAEQESWLQQALDRLGRHEPLQYILGEVQFLSCTIKVRAPMLIPRTETEEWVAQLIEYVRKQQIAPERILDIGTGSGCIALALAQAFPDSQVIGVDIHPNAIELSRENGQLNGVKNAQFVQSDLYEQLPDDLLFDIIVSNPPYVRELDWQNLDRSVQDWEDKNAVVAQDDGLAIIKRIINGSVKRLRACNICVVNFTKNPLALSARRSPWAKKGVSNGCGLEDKMLCIEIDIHQGNIVQQLLHEAGFFDVTITKDLHGRDRVVWGKIHGTH